MGLPSIKPRDYTKGAIEAVRIFTEYGGFIRAVICYHIKDKDRADDLFQDFFLSLVAKPLPPDVQNTKCYLYKMIINGIIDAACRIEKYQNRIRRYAAHKRYSITEEGPESSLIESEEMNKMFKLIEKQLSRSESRAVILRYKNHYTVKEVAGKMNVASESVSRYISVGIGKIREFITISKSR